MEERTVGGIRRDWVEPAHPAAVRRFEDLVTIYRFIREQLQGRIDEAFNGVSQEIGFVVTTTLPVTLETTQKGAVQWGVSEEIKGSLFEKAILRAVSSTKPEPTIASPGKYRLYLVWFEALKLKLRKDWLEPVHYLPSNILERIGGLSRVRPEVMEPAHWFDPGLAIAGEEQILISAIDEVYPELRLAERVALTRQLLRKVRPEVMEPAHIRPEVMEPAHTRPGVRAELVLREIAQLLRHVRPEVMEPAHFRPLERDILSDIESVLSKYGV